MSLRVLICDERPLVSGGLRGVLLLAPDMDVVGSVVSISEAQSLIRATAPHVVVTGLRPGGTIGAAFVRELVREYAGDPAGVSPMLSLRTAAR